MKSLPVSTVAWSDLKKNRLHRQKPVLVKGITASAKQWTPEYVLRKAGDVKVPIRMISNGNYRGASIKEMTVSAYYKAMTSDVNKQETPYLSEVSYDNYFPELAKDLIAPPQIQQEIFRERVMYFGRTVNSQIHYHPAGSALLFMLYGRKIVCLYPPDQTDCLYKVPRANFSAITIGHVGSPNPGVDLTQYPKFAQAQCMEIVVNPGDVLLIPIYWWHSIQNVDGVSISAVYFWRLPGRRKQKGNSTTRPLMG